MNSLTFTADAENSGVRIDKFLCAHETELSRSALQKLMENGAVTVNGKAVANNYKLKTADIITIDVPDPVELQVQPQNIPIEIVYEDDSLLVVNKPKGMVVHPAAGNPDGTLVNALLYHCKGRLSSINGVIRPGIVHRIDKNTSGLLMVAKTDKAHSFLAEQIKDHSFTREYNAITLGRFKEGSGTISAPIGRSKYDRKKMCVTPLNSKEAVTHFEVLEELGHYSLVKFKLETGRTHQIRVHCAYMGCPVLGDDVYGKAFKGLEGQCLHAKKLGFVHPETLEYMEFDSPLPDYFTAVLEKLRKGL
ncbi:MAG: RluA family pseudouridine synthase [Ruminococcus sp.]|nr:RluA family pseudouridine synthase [Ruminococcus sp.]